MAWPTALPLIAILRGITPEDVVEHVEALLQEGFDAIEIPLNSPDWEKSIPLAVRQAGDRALVGAGTVLSVELASRVADLGGTLMVTPNTDPDVIRRARSRGLYTAIGFMTPSEAFAALAAGAQSLKLFPSSNLGPSYIKAIRAVLPPDVPLLAVGGVTPDNLGQFLDAGCIGAGLGGDLYKPGQPVSRTREQAAAFVKAYRSN
ncbi:2-dehydro-3-deoxy-6-phosphogalactonate aldolase [Luteibacter rhizovicinus DSM 16549]|uniref:2-dehydro-3-deoxy-6-phosphogalactonate aldolase n=1 Tax=Luteibacter rhizovicinus DSM 16549 TaxID=1440763 RepID=A0A0G9HBD7_9GAMM|nr:2-dehydro-3-deoxy-6-phosphogalactonate aldolase [Luteibacter rhizovicinus]APG04063.1 2-dehydro-3-deoxy-6-phosphogalactonate aldolase [Luteibacter rhizovicinus DSM 16549]KLD66554.1 2-dehydro-3-deoxy-6-phosphogalactonate aldolase [Luteibacter rhizovicinus DSM 16549]KLD77180.1 2-dehydro-3-deoxy-6-phosphogalactonate aldolase [Xanthomonas hyacinthi DSM 19077]